MRHALVVALLLAPAAALADARTDTITVRAKQNDSFGLIASEYYGDRNKAAFILAENKIVHPKPLRPGQLLRVPVLRELVTAPGDTFPSLAEALLGDARRGGFLAEVNKLSPDDSLPAGVALVVPFTVTHTAQGTESLEALAANYYGDRKHADVLRRFNNLDKPAIEKGEAIVVPAFNLRMHPGRVLPSGDPDAKTRRAKREDTQRLAASALPAAKHAWRIGEYAAVKKQLEPVDPAYLDTAQAVELGILLGSAHVAFKEDEAALAAFRRVLDRKPSHKLRKLDHAPKVIAVWTKADGQVE